MDVIFATAKSGDVYVFRHNFNGNKWENVTNKKDGSSLVTFRKRGNMFYIRIIPDGGTKEEYQLSHNAEIKDSGEGFIQIPLPEKKQLIGIKFKKKEDAPIFLGKIKEQMDIKTNVVMQVLVMDDKPVTMAPNPEQLPKAMVTNYGIVGGHTTLPTTINQRKPAPPPQSNIPHAQDRSRPTPNQPQPDPRINPVGEQHGPNSPQYNAPYNPAPSQFNAGQSQFNAGQQQFDVGYNPGQPVGQAAFNSGQPNYSGQSNYSPGQPGYNPGQPVKASGAMVAAAVGSHGVVQDPIPIPRPEPEVPSFSTGEDAISEHATFLANAINAGNFEAAYRLMNLLEKIKDGKKLKITCTDEPNPMADDPEVTLETTIEFQNQHKLKLHLYLNFKAGLTIKDIQQHLELSHHIPKATQSWIIGDKLVKGEMMKKTLRDFGIDGAGTKAKVFVYVMHSKKAQVPKEEYEAIRQCQQEERERKRQGIRHPWQMSTSTVTPPAPPRHNMESPGTMQAGNIPQSQRIQAWGQGGGVEDDHNMYSRVNRNIPQSAAPIPPVRQHVDFDPTYQHLHNYQEHPAESRPHPQPTLQPRIPPDQQITPGGGGIRYVAPQQQPPPTHQYHQQPLQQTSQGGPSQHVQGPRPSQMPPQQHQPPQLPPEPVVSKPPPDPPKIGWSCPKCTFINKPRRPGCEICAADRPEDYEVPGNVPLDEDEARILAGLQGSDNMFQEYTEEERRRQENQRAKNLQALLQAEEEAIVTNDEEFECPICYTDVEPDEGVRLRGCLHLFCKDCLKGSIMASPDAEVKCPFRDDDYECNVTIPEREIRQLVDAEDLQKLYRRGLQQAETSAPNSYHCKSTNCEGFCFYEDEVNEFNCPICKKVNCLTCKAIHEGINCQEYQEDLKRRAANDEAAKATQEMLDKMLNDGNAMHCPSCKIVVQKKDGCDWMRCSVCKTEICWATKQARWGPKGKGDKSGGCHCREVNGKKCHPLCRNCH